MRYTQKYDALLRQPGWICSEEQYEAVNMGDLCPACLSIDTLVVASTPAGVRDLSFKRKCLCNECGEQWEGI